MDMDKTLICCGLHCYFHGYPIHICSLMAVGVWRRYESMIG